MINYLSSRARNAPERQSTCSSSNKCMSVRFTVEGQFYSPVRQIPLPIRYPSTLRQTDWHCKVVRMDRTPSLDSHEPRRLHQLHQRNRVSGALVCAAMRDKVLSHTNQKAHLSVWHIKKANMTYLNARVLVFRNRRWKVEKITGLERAFETRRHSGDDVGMGHANHESARVAELGGAM